MRVCTLLLLTLLIAVQLIATSSSDCRRLSNGALIPDSENCARYYKCRNGRAVRRSCGRGLYFDTYSRVCVVAAFANCYGGIEIPEPIVGIPTASPTTVSPKGTTTTVCPTTTTICPTTTTTCPTTTTTCPTTTTTCPTTTTTCATP